MYNDFSLIYDRFQEIDYREFINFYIEVFNRNNYEPHSIIDLGCGSRRNNGFARQKRL